MRITHLRSIAAAALGLAACSNAATGIGSPMDASLTITSLSQQPESADITAAGDSVILTVIRTNTCGYEQRATVLRGDASLAITVTLVGQYPSLCDPAIGSTQYRAAVRHVPSGSYAVTGHFRTEVGSQINDTIVSTQTVSIP